MKLLVCCFTYILGIALFNHADASVQIAGTLYREINRSTVQILLDNNKKYTISSTDSETILSLNKMNPGDLIIGSGTLDNNANILYLETVDYVGLQRVLGLWHADNGLIEFRSFSDMNVYSKVIDARNVLSTTTSKKQFKYSITPSTGNEWVLFLSDNDSTVMGTMEVNRSYAVIKVLDTQTGNVKQVIRMSKVTN